MRQLACGDRVDAQELGGFHAAVASDDLLRIVHQDRVTEAELLDAVCDLANLLFECVRALFGCGRNSRTGVYSICISPISLAFVSPRMLKGLASCRGDRMQEIDRLRRSIGFSPDFRRAG